MFSTEQSDFKVDSHHGHTIMQFRTFIGRRFCRFLCLLLAAVMAAGPSASVWAQTNAAAQAVRQRVSGLGEAPGEVPAENITPSEQTLIAAPGAGKVEAKYVAPSAAVVAVLRPAQIMSSPLTAMLPREVATAAGMKFLGFDPADVDEVTAFGDMQNPMAPSYGLTINFNKPFKGSSIPAEARVHAQLGELNGKKYLQSQHPMLPSFYGPNNRTLVIAPDVAIRSMVEAGGQSPSSPLLDRVRNVPSGSDLYVAVDVAALKGLFQMMLAQAAAQLPPDVQPFLEAPNLISSAELTVNLTTNGPTSLVVHANDEAAATQLETLITDADTKFQQNLKLQLAEQAVSNDPIERAWAQYAERISADWSKPFMPTREGATLTLFRREAMTDEEKKLFVTMAGVGTALLLPAVQASRQAARRSQGMNNLKQLALGILNYHDVKKSLPAHANYSEDGKPLLSWRVHILPFVEQNALYQQFHLDEPWDSEHNKQLIAQMPDVFKAPGVPLEQGKTNYLAVVGEGCAFNGTKDGLGLQDITDGTSKTVSVVEADPDQAVEWTKPDDWEYNAEAPNAGLGNIHQGGWNAVFLDGHVQFISNAIDVNALRAIMTRAGRETVDAF
jgi:prepilin-type processing-associated H-X9-DG protein